MPQPSPALQKVIAEWVTHAKANDRGLVSADGSALRIYADMGGSVFIRPDGSLIGETESRVPEAVDAVWQTVALVVGARTHPELRELLPKRTATAEDCARCNASGMLHGSVCGRCSGLGWTPAA